MKINPAMFAVAMLLLAVSCVSAQSSKPEANKDRAAADKLAQVQQISEISGRSMLVVAGEVAN